MSITPEQHFAVVAAFDDPAVRLGHGLGSANGERCTVAAIHLALTGRLTDAAHPCISEVIRRWVIRIQDAMPLDLLNSPEWRAAAVGIAGSAARAAVERERAELILAWMWERLGDESVPVTVPATARPAWNRMLAERTDADAAAYAAYAVAAAAADVAYAAAYDDDVADDAADADAAYAAYAAAVAAAAGYWRRANPAELLARLTKLA